MRAWKDRKWWTGSRGGSASERASPSLALLWRRRRREQSVLARPDGQRRRRQRSGRSRRHVDMMMLFDCARAGPSGKIDNTFIAPARFHSAPVCATHSLASEQARALALCLSPDCPRATRKPAGRPASQPARQASWPPASSQAPTEMAAALRAREWARKSDK